MSAPSHSIETLKQRSEQCRANLKQTIDELSQTLSDTTAEIKSNLSPSHLKHEARAYARVRGKSAVNALKENVRNKPLESLAVGAVAAYPLLGLVRRIPVPLALVGAGLLLCRNTTASADEERRFKQKDEERPDTPPEEVQQGTAIAAAAVKEKLAETAATASQAASTIGDSAARASRMINGTSDAVVGLVHRNALLVGAFAVAAGGIIAASLPASRMEGSVLGKANDALRGQGRKAAAHVVRGVKERVAEVADDIATAAQQEGLAPDALDAAVGTTADKVASVVTRAVDEAIGSEPTESNNESDDDGDQYGRP